MFASISGKLYRFGCYCPCIFVREVKIMYSWRALVSQSSYLFLYRGTLIRYTNTVQLFSLLVCTMVSAEVPPFCSAALVVLFICCANVDYSNKSSMDSAMMMCPLFTSFTESFDPHFSSNEHWSPSTVCPMYHCDQLIKSPRIFRP
jgi:hypothetical protein